jgi:hypothetical protein
MANTAENLTRLGHHASKFARRGNMKKYLIAAALVLCAPQALLAEEVFYVVRDNTTNQCRVMPGNELSTTQKARYKELGKYATMDEAKAALDSMMGTACK